MNVCELTSYTNTLWHIQIPMLLTVRGLNSTAYLQRKYPVRVNTPAMLCKARFATESEQRVCAWLSSRSAWISERNKACLAYEVETAAEEPSTSTLNSSWELQQLGLLPEEMAPTEVSVPARNILYTVWNFIQLPELPSLARAGAEKLQLLELLLSRSLGSDQYVVQLEDVCHSMLSHARSSLQKVGVILDRTYWVI